MPDMASAVTTTESQGRAVATERAAEVTVAAPSRREFLYYIWTASLLLLLGQAGAALIWFALPRFKEGTFGGVFNLAPERIPELNAGPTSVAEGRFHVVHVDDGLNVLFGVCTHLGCLPRWDPGEVRFLCPCHGSQFALDGHYLAGPAPRSLDRFEVTVTFADGSQVVSNAIGDPIPVDGKTVVGVAINTGKKINRGSKN
jgi:cytochrome b6-f complex iron-sulfur subunit